MNPVYPIESTGLTDLVGHFIKADGAGGFTAVDGATDLHVGCLDHALSATKGGLAVVGARTRVKVTGAVSQFGFGKLNADATASAYTGGEGEVRCCQFLQAGTDGELVNAVIM